MAIKTLKDITHINTIPLFHISERKPVKNFEEVLKTRHFIMVDHVNNALLIQVQNGPVKENGENGAQVDDIIQMCLTMISGLNEQFPCEHNLYAMQALDQALKHLADRKLDRIQRDVEGTNQL